MLDSTIPTIQRGNIITHLHPHTHTHPHPHPHRAATQDQPPLVFKSHKASISFLRKEPTMFTANYKGVGRRSRTLIEGEREGGGGGQGEESQAKLPRKYRMPFKV